MIERVGSPVRSRRRQFDAEIGGVLVGESDDPRGPAGQLESGAQAATPSRGVEYRVDRGCMSTHLLDEVRSVTDRCRSELTDEALVLRAGGRLVRARSEPVSAFHSGWNGHR